MQRRLLSLAIALTPVALLAQQASAPSKWKDQILPKAQAAYAKVRWLALHVGTAPKEDLEAVYAQLDELRAFVKTLKPTAVQRERFDDWYIAQRVAAGEYYSDRRLSGQTDREVDKTWDRLRLAFEDD